MRVRANAKGYYGGKRISPGDVFVVPEGSTASWFEEIELKPKGPDKDAPGKKVSKKKSKKASKKTSKKKAKKKAG